MILNMEHGTPYYIKYFSVWGGEEGEGYSTQCDPKVIVERYEHFITGHYCKRKSETLESVPLRCTVH